MAKKATKSAMPVPDADTHMCVIYGEEEMIKRQLLDELRTAMQQKHGDVETLIFDGKTATLADVLDELRSYGLMQQYKIVIVDDADIFVTQHRQAMERYAESPVDNGTLVFRASKWNKGGLDKAINKVGFIHKCDPLKPAEATSWVNNQAKEKYERKLEPQAASFLVERLGTDLMRLDAELSKLTLMIDPKAAIGRDLIEQVVGKSNEEKAWVVQEAVLKSLASGRGGPAMEKIHELVDDGGQPDVLVSYFIADLIRKLYMAKAMLKQGQSEGEIGRAMRLFGPQQAVFMTVLRKMDETRLAMWLDRIVELDVRSKSGRGDTLRNLELFAGAMTTAGSGPQSTRR